MEEFGEGLKELKGMAIPQEDQHCQLTQTPGSSQKRSHQTKSIRRLVQGPQHVYSRRLPCYWERMCPILQRLDVLPRKGMAGCTLQEANGMEMGDRRKKSVRGDLEAGQYLGITILLPLDTSILYSQDKLYYLIVCWITNFHCKFKCSHS